MTMSHPHSNIVEPHAHDVLSGRGAGITKHQGNKRWRELIKNNRERYSSLPRNQRPVIAEHIVKAVRSLNPPGRFLTKDATSGTWMDIGDDRATEKTAQAMRDSKKNSKDQSSPTVSPAVSPVSSPVVSKKSIALVPQSNVQCSPKIARPQMNRLQTDDTFSQRMEGFTFEPPFLQSDPSAMFLRDSVVGPSVVPSAPLQCSSKISKPFIDRENTFDKRLEGLDLVVGPFAPAQCSPKISKPFMERESTFDKRLEGFDFSLAPPQQVRSESLFSAASFDMMGEDELEMLEASCGMPSSQRFSNAHFQMMRMSMLNSTRSIMEQDGDAVMEDLPRPSIRYSRRMSTTDNPFHWSL